MLRMLEVLQKFLRIYSHAVMHVFNGMLNYNDFYDNNFRLSKKAATLP